MRVSNLDHAVERLVVGGQRNAKEGVELITGDHQGNRRHKAGEDGPREHVLDETEPQQAKNQRDDAWDEIRRKAR